MAKVSFNFNPKSGPAILITGGIMFVLVGIFAKINFPTLLGVSMMLGVSH